MKALIDRLERAAAAYERLGKVSKDTEKTRGFRMVAMAELTAARVALLNSAIITDAKVEAAAREAYGKHYARYMKMMRRALEAAAKV